MRKIRKLYWTHPTEEHPLTVIPPRFNIGDGSLSNINTQKYYAMEIAGATASAIVMPGREGLVTIYYEGIGYDWDTEEVDFIAGTEYTYTVTIKPSSSGEPDPVVKVRLESSINDWNKVNGGTINGSTSVTVTALPDDVISGTITSFPLSPTPENYYEFELENTTAESTITIETIVKTGNDSRIVAFGLKAN